MVEYLAMDGYAGYIWAAWSSASLLLLAIWAASARLLRYQSALLAALETTEKHDPQNHDPQTP